MPRHPFVLPLFIAASACGDGSTSMAASLDPVVRDSAGVRVVEYRAEVLAALPSIHFDPVPMLEIGRDEEFDLTQLVSASIISGGRLVTFRRNPDEPLLTLVDADGATLRHIGRHGEGPGEFSTEVLVRPGPSGTIAVDDAQRSRLTIIHPDSGVIGMVRTDPAINEDLYGLLADGSVFMAPVARAYRPLPPGEAATRESEERLLAMKLLAGWEADPDRIAIDTLATVRGPTSVNAPTYIGIGMVREFMMPLRWSAVPKYAVWNGVAAVADNRSREIRRYRSDGSLDLVFRIAAPLRPVADDIWQRLEEQAGRTWDSASVAQRQGIGRSEAVKVVRQQRVADSVAPYGQLVPSIEGGWLIATEQGLPLDSVIGAIAIDRDGRLVGRVEWSIDRKLMAIGEDRIVFQVTDDDGFTLLRVHRIRWTDDG